MKFKTKNKKLKIILATLTVSILSISVYIADTFSDELLAPARSNFDDTFNDYSKDINYPSDYYKSAINYPFEVVSDFNYTLIGEFLPTPNDVKGTVYYLHGYGSNRSQGIWFLQMYHDLGYNVVLYDHVGSGDSGGDYSTMGLYETEDLHTIKTYVEKTYPTGKNKVLHGVSMGGATALYYGEVYGNGIDYIVADCSYSAMKDIVLYQFGEQFDLPHFPFIPLANIGLKVKGNYTLNDVDLLNSVASDNYKNIDVLYIHGDADNFTPYQMSVDLHNATIGNSTLQLFQGVDHADAYQSNPQLYKTLVMNLLNN